MKRVFSFHIESMDFRWGYSVWVPHTQFFLDADEAAGVLESLRAEYPYRQYRLTVTWVNEWEFRMAEQGLKYEPKGVVSNERDQTSNT